MTSFFARRAAGLFALAFAGALAGCQSLQASDSFLGVITPYRIEVGRATSSPASRSRSPSRG